MIFNAIGVIFCVREPARPPSGPSRPPRPVVPGRAAHTKKDANAFDSNAFASPYTLNPSPEKCRTGLFQKIKAMRADFAKRKCKVLTYTYILFHFRLACSLLRPENCKSHDAREAF